MSGSNSSEKSSSSMFSNSDSSSSGKSNSSSLATSGSSSGSQGTSYSKPVTYQNLMTPEQLQGISTLGPQVINDAALAMQGYGLTPAERTRQEGALSGRLNDYAGAMKDSVLSGYAANDVTGGVQDAFMKNLDTSKLMGFSSGLRDIEDMNQAAIQQKLGNAMAFTTWAPPVAQESGSQQTAQSLADSLSQSLASSQEQSQSTSEAASKSKGKSTAGGFSLI